MDYEFRTEPFPHQRDVFQRMAELPGFALFWEQGCGKTKPVIDNVAYLFEKDQIDALVVVAPSGVHRNWKTDEIPTHMPLSVIARTSEILWETSKAGNVGFQRDLENLLAFRGLAVIYISYDAFTTGKAVKFLGRFFRKRRVFFAIDEAHNIKTAGATRTRTVRTAAKHTKYRRTLTGTPGDSPFDLYSQVAAIDSEFWKAKGFPDYSCFKAHFGEFLPRQFVKANMGFDPGFDGLLKGFKNLDELNGYLQEVGSRVTKETAGLNLPPKLYSKRYFELSKSQRAAYDTLRHEFEVELDTGELITAPLAIVKLLRLQQITCGYVGTGEEDRPLVELSGPNPRLGLAEEIRDGLHKPTIWWSRFTEDSNKLMDLLGKRAVRYDGSVDEDARARAKLAFQGGEATHFVGNPQAGATGLTLVQAKHTVYYSNSFRLTDRLQSEDRLHRIGQTDPVDYTDLVAVDTIDLHIVESLRNKFDVATQINGDAVREWI